MLNTIDELGAYIKEIRPYVFWRDHLCEFDPSDGGALSIEHEDGTIQVISWECVDEEGGSGQGNDAMSVMEFSDCATGLFGYIRFDYEYWSSEGFIYDNMESKVVKPITKKITVYE